MPSTMRNYLRIARNSLFCESGLVNQCHGTLGRLFVAMRVRDFLAGNP